MERFEISEKVFPELKGNVKEFVRFMEKEFDAYIEDGKNLLAHNEGDSHWFTKQYLEAKSGKGIYADFFEKKKPSRSRFIGDPNDLGGTGHGDISYSDADPGL